VQRLARNCRSKSNGCQGLANLRNKLRLLPIHFAIKGRALDDHQCGAVHVECLMEDNAILHPEIILPYDR
jgi:hypothetical protein